MLQDLHFESHTLVADEYVATEARRNMVAKTPVNALDYLEALLAQIEVSPVQYPVVAHASVAWLPEKDRPILMAAIALKCEALVHRRPHALRAGFWQDFSRGHGLSAGPTSAGHLSP